MDCPLRFPGQYHDPETGLHYNHHRYYDPETGAYTGPDPLGLAASPHPHGYVANPYAWIDPYGLVPCPKKIRDRIGKLFASQTRQQEIVDQQLRARRVPMRLGDLKDMDLPDVGSRPDKESMVRGMGDERLLEAINNPDELGSIITLGDEGTIVQGNHRIYEALRRMRDPKSPLIDPETIIMVLK